MRTGCPPTSSSRSPTAGGHVRGTPPTCRPTAKAERSLGHPLRDVVPPAPPDRVPAHPRPVARRGEGPFFRRRLPPSRWRPASTPSNCSALYAALDFDPHRSLWQLHAWETPVPCPSTRLLTAIDTRPLKTVAAKVPAYARWSPTYTGWPNWATAGHLAAARPPPATPPLTPPRSITPAGTSARSRGRAGRPSNHGIGLLPWAPRAGGVFTGKYRGSTPADFPFGASRAWPPYVEPATAPTRAPGFPWKPWSTQPKTGSLGSNRRLARGAWPGSRNRARRRRPHRSGARRTNTASPPPDRCHRVPDLPRRPSRAALDDAGASNSAYPGRRPRVIDRVNSWIEQGASGTVPGGVTKTVPLRGSVTRSRRRRRAGFLRKRAGLVTTALRAEVATRRLLIGPTFPRRPAGRAPSVAADRPATSPAARPARPGRRTIVAPPARRRDRHDRRPGTHTPGRPPNRGPGQTGRVVGLFLPEQPDPPRHAEGGARCPHGPSHPVSLWAGRGRGAPPPLVRPRKRGRPRSPPDRHHNLWWPVPAGPEPGHVSLSGLTAGHRGPAAGHAIDVASPTARRQNPHDQRVARQPPTRSSPRRKVSYAGPDPLRPVDVDPRPGPGRSAQAKPRRWRAHQRRRRRLRRRPGHPDTREPAGENCSRFRHRARC